MMWSKRFLVWTKLEMWWRAVWLVDIIVERVAGPRCRLATANRLNRMFILRHVVAWSRPLVVVVLRLVGHYLVPTIVVVLTTMVTVIGRLVSNF
jgi:hypothetical protein